MAPFYHRRLLGAAAQATPLRCAERFVNRRDRVHRNGHESGVLWLTGLSGAGKTTLAFGLEHALFQEGYSVYVLDGDNLRQGVNADLGFSPEHRAENIRRASEIAALFSRAGMLVIAAFISPKHSDRAYARKAAGDGFCEIYVKADVRTCMRRDPKGLYARARRGELRDFTGVSAPYDVPEHAELIIDTTTASVTQSLAVLTSFVAERFPLM